MTDRDDGPVAPIRPVDSSGDAWVGLDRVAALAVWMVQHAGAFTDVALERSARTAGYTDAEIADARSRADARIAAEQRLRPVRSSARRVVIAAYALVWILFCIGYTTQPAPSWLDLRFLLLGILTVALLIGLIASIVINRFVHPDAERPTRAFALFLAVPAVLLTAVAGICLPGVVRL
jgi:hypothetical protein